MYESDTATVTRYNATLTVDGDFAKGQALGWVPTNNAQEYRLSEIFTNEEGIILRVQGLPYGQYIVVETTVPKDVFQAEPFCHCQCVQPAEQLLLFPPAASQRPAAAT